MGDARHGGFQPDLVHGFAEFLAVFGLVDDIGLGADHLNAVFGQHTRRIKRQGAVQRRLPTHGRQERIGAFLGDNLFDKFRGDRLDIGGIGQIRIGHDRRRVGIDQHDEIAS